MNRDCNLFCNRAYESLTMEPDEVLYDGVALKDSKLHFGRGIFDVEIIANRMSIIESQSENGIYRTYIRGEVKFPTPITGSNEEIRIIGWHHEGQYEKK